MDSTCTINAVGEILGATGERVPWWSFTKTVIAIASFKAVEEGAVDLHEPFGAGGWTLLQMLRHEAGLPDYGAWPDYQEAVAAGAEPWPASIVWERGLAASNPRRDWSYSNIGYALVRALLVERTSRSFSDLLSSVLDPAGAGSTRLAEARADLTGVQGLARGYHPGWVYHGLLVGPLSDAARVIRALVAGQLLGDRSLDEMQRLTHLPHFRSALWREAAYGAGVMSPRLASGRRLVGHTGGGPASEIAVYAVETPQGPAAAAGFSDTGANVERTVANLLESLAGN